MIRVLLLFITCGLSITISAQSSDKRNLKAGNPFGPYVLFDQINNHNETYQIPTQQFPENNDCRVEAAERFEVPSGQTWSITELYIALAPHSGVNKVRLTVYDRSPMGTPGFALYDEEISMATSVSSLTPVEPSEQISLYSGIYFISVTPIVDASTGNITLTYADAGSGEQIFIKDPCNIIGSGPAWVRVGESLAFGGTQMHDLAIQVYGVSCTESAYITGDKTSSSITRTTFALASDASLIGDQITIFESRKDIDIIPGFSVDHDCLFIANIKDCSLITYDFSDN